MAHCTSCGQELAENARFCSQCGTAVGAQRMAGPQAQADTAAKASGDGQQSPEAPAGDPAARIWTGWPSRKRHVPMLALSLLLIVGGVIAGLAAPPLFAVAALGGLGLLWVAARMLCEPLATRYSLTSDRLFIRKGILRVTTDQTELIRVDDIRVRQGPLDLVFNIGNVEVIANTDATDGDTTLVGVCDPMHVAELIRTGMQNARRRRGIYVQNV